MFCKWACIRVFCPWTVYVFASASAVALCHCACALLVFASAVALCFWACALLAFAFAVALCFCACVLAFAAFTCIFFTPHHPLVSALCVRACAFEFVSCANETLTWASDCVTRPHPTIRSGFRLAGVVRWPCGCCYLSRLLLLLFLLLRICSPPPHPFTIVSITQSTHIVLVTYPLRGTRHVVGGCELRGRLT